MIDSLILLTINKGTNSLNKPINFKLSNIKTIINCFPNILYSDYKLILLHNSLSSVIN